MVVTLAHSYLLLIAPGFCSAFPLLLHRFLESDLLLSHSGKPLDGFIYFFYIDVVHETQFSSKSLINGLVFVDCFHLEETNTVLRVNATQPKKLILNKNC